MLTIINRYKNIIDKNLANEILDIKEYKEKKEIYDAFTVGSIIRVSDFVVMSNYQLVELKDYEIEKSYEKQNNIIKEIINEYMK